MRNPHIRKALRRRNYDYSKGGAYFITVCVRDRHEMLGNIVGDDDHIVPRTELSELGCVVKKFINGINDAYTDVYVDKYVIMPNHIHMIVFLQYKTDGPMWSSAPTVIPQIIRSFKTLVTKECGYSFWQRSFHDRVIRNYDEYERIWHYVDENVARWADDRYYVRNVRRGR